MRNHTSVAVKGAGEVGAWGVREIQSVDGAQWAECGGCSPTPALSNPNVNGPLFCYPVPIEVIGEGRCADAVGMMIVLANNKRRGRKRFPPDYCRAGEFDPLASIDRVGIGSGGGAGLADWQRPAKIELRTIFTGRGFTPKMCTIIESRMKTAI
jgi:hypothetical protein